MKEIKFKFYDKEYKSTYLSGDFDSLGEFFIFKETHYKNCELNEYTGLKDKNGKEIYEGDILKVKKTIYEVKYRDHTGGYSLCINGEFVTELNSNNAKMLNLIGNIYKNKELLEVK